MIQFGRRYLYKTCLTPYKAPVCIISIGNMIAGGSGKTPFTIYLAELLKEKGLRVAVSHRGYKSNLEKKTTLISDRDGLLDVAEEAGDEAWLLAKRLTGIPVIAGKNRRQAIRILCQKFPDLDCIILDDSFQHLQVAHDLDFIIVNERLGFGNGFIMPAGYLREPLRAIKNADAVILNKKTELSEPDSQIIGQINQSACKVMPGFYKLEQIYDFDGNSIAADRIVCDKVIIAAAIGNPEGFKDLIRNNGLNLTGGITYRDHYDYSDKSARTEILSYCAQRQAKWIATTEKDFAKLRKYPEFGDNLLVFQISFQPLFEIDELTNLVQERLHNKR